MRRKIIVSIYLTGFLFLSAPSFAIEPNKLVKVTPLLKTTTTWNGAKIAYPEGEAEITALIVEIAPGGETGWHHHPVPSFGMLLEGTLEVKLEDGKTKQIQAGEALAEVINTLHNGKNIGDKPVKILVFYAGTTDKQVTVKKSELENLKGYSK